MTSLTVSSGPIALSDSRWVTGDFCFEAAPRPAPGRFSIRAYNGQIVAPGKNEPVEAFSWNAEQPLRLALRYCEPSQRKADRTLVRLESEQDSFSVAVEDVLASSAVYVRDFGVFVTRGDHPQRLSEYEQRIAAQETILQRVRKMPDQTLDQAMNALWRPIQNNGPTMLSLACDNEKFIVDRDGTLHYGPLRMSVRFGAGTAEVTRLDFGLVGLDTTVRPTPPRRVCLCGSPGGRSPRGSACTPVPKSSCLSTGVTRRSRRWSGSSPRISRVARPRCRSTSTGSGASIAGS